MGVADAEMEKKDITFSYLNAKLTESIYIKKSKKSWTILSLLH